ncbi:MAG: hypothetical protein ACYS8I_15665 [Planctomycetota bacterium]|jgi:hypothetical protein
MLENDGRFNYSLEKDDCLRAVKVARRWKTLLVLVLAACLLLLQASFYLVDHGYVTIADQSSESEPVAADNAEVANPVLRLVSRWLPVESMSEITFDQLTWTINLANAVLILAMVLYCLTLQFSVNVSITGGLGGMKHITRAFLLSLLMLILFLPWQKLFGSLVTGAMFTPDEMVKWYSSRANESLDTAIYYMRFSGYGVSILLLLLLSHMGSLLWISAIRRRVRVIQVERDLASVPRPLSREEVPGRVVTV